VATNGGRVRLPLGKVAKRVSRALQRFPTEADWSEGFERAKRLRDQTHATWLDFAWLVHEEADGWNLDQLNAGRFDFRFGEQPRQTSDSTNGLRKFTSVEQILRET
jgi:hypothetical protein